MTGATVLVDVDATDADSSPLAYTIIGGNSEGYFEINSDGEITLTPLGESEVAASHVNNQTFDLAIKVSDGTLSDSTSVSIRVVDNYVDIPTIDLPASMDNGLSDSDDLTSFNQPTLDIGNIATDALQVTIIDGSSVLQAQALRSSVTGLWIVNNAGDGSLSYSGGEWTFTPDSTLADGTHTYTVIVVDDAGNEEDSTLSLTVDTTGPDMDISGVPDSVNETLTHIGQVVATDANGPVVYAVADTNFVIDSAGNLSFAVDGNGNPLLSNYETNQSHSVTVTATDSLGNSSSEVIDIDVNNITGNVTVSCGDVTYLVSHTFDWSDNEGWLLNGSDDYNDAWFKLGSFGNDSDKVSQEFNLSDNSGETVTINADLNVWGGSPAWNGWEGNDTF